MTTWTRVKWTEAGQIAELLNWERDLGGLGRASPEAFFAYLRRNDRLEDAAFFVAQALPRYEAVVWATRMARDLRHPPLSPGPEADALRAALLWVQDPSDMRRRAAFEAANRVRDPGPERLAAFAAYFSGGSITPPDAPPVQAPKQVAGRFAGGAVLLAAAVAGDRAAALARALDVGAGVAQNGLDALSG